MSTAPPRVRFVSVEYAGWATRSASLRREAFADSRIAAEFHSVTGWREGGLVERVPLLPRGARGRLRALAEASALVRLPRPDVAWMSAREELSVFAWIQAGLVRRPLVLELDATDQQAEAMARWYVSRNSKSFVRSALARLQDAMAYRAVTMFTPWSNWAAEGLRAEGVRSERIRVMPPGVDLRTWSPSHRDNEGRPVRVLFVGGDFVRKGGDLLVDVLRHRQGSVEGVLVTRDDVRDLPPNVRVERAGPDSAKLRALYAWADVFALPTRAECFGLASVEAMAAGLPAIVGDVGGARDIVEPGVTGWLIEPDAACLAGAVDAAVRRRSELTEIGARARQRAEERFDAKRNNRAVIDLLLEVHAESRPDAASTGQAR